VIDVFVEELNPGELGFDRADHEFDGTTDWSRKGAARKVWREHLDLADIENPFGPQVLPTLQYEP
jgi:hypothetical protein